ISDTPRGPKTDSTHRRHASYVGSCPSRATGKNSILPSSDNVQHAKVSSRIRESLSSPPPASIILGVLNASLVEGEVLGVTQRQPEKVPLHGPQFMVHPQVDAFDR